MNVETENQAQATDAPVVPAAGPQLRVRYPDGRKEPMTLEKMTSLVREFSAGLVDVDVAADAGLDHTTSGLAECGSKARSMA